jgi:hypothetical protein
MQVIMGIKQCITHGVALLAVLTQTESWHGSG